MRIIVSKIVFILIFLSAATVRAEESVWANIGNDLASPVTTDASKILWPGTALTAFLLLEEKNISDPFQESTVERKPLGSWSKYGDLMGQLVPNAIYVGAMWGYGYFEQSDLAKERALVMLKASIYSGLVADIIKELVREPRPYNGSIKNSFPSGHSTSAFSFASVVHAEHGLAWGVPAYALATFVAYSRINDNKHMLHDVVAGAVIGTSYGFGMYYRSLQTKPRAVASAQPVFEYSVMPVVDADFTGLSLYGEF